MKPKIQGKIAVILWLALNVLVLNFYGVAGSDILKFAVAVFLAAFIPGLLLVNVIAHDHYRGWYKLALALVVGIALDIFCYIAFAALQIKPFLYFFFALLVLRYISSSWLRKDVALCTRLLSKPLDKYEAGWLLLLMGLLVLTAKIYFSPNLLPGQGDIIYSVDYPWHIGNIAEILNHWPPQDPRLAGFPFHYHIFFYVLTAFFSYLTGISIPVLFFRLVVPFLLYLCMLGAYFAGSRWYGRKEIGLISAAVFLTAGTALLSHPYNIFLKNLFFSPTFLLASLVCLFFLIELKAYLKDEGSLFLLLILTGVLSGAKGSFFPVIFAGLALTCAYYMLGKDKSGLKKTVILCSGSLVIFFAVYFYIYGLTPGGEGIKLFPLEIVYNTHIYKVYEQIFKLDTVWMVIFFIPVYLLLFFSFRLLAYVDGIKELIKNKSLSPDRFFLAATILVSFIPAYLLSYRGTSQYYFLFVGYICLNLMASAYIYKTVKGEKGRTLRFIVMILLFISFADTIGMVNDTARINGKLAALSSKPLTEGLYEGLVFLRDHTEKDAVIAARRAFLLTPDNARFFYYSAFSERRILVEGWQYMSLERQKEAEKRYADMTLLYFTRDEKTAARIIHKYDVDYLIVDKKARQRLRFKGEGLLVKCFENSEVVIFKVIK
ncbi:hypothetical protein SAMN02745221_00681 [Thermosyntropha lipolytica DSM 11003]|uniref:Glycosyltransferase RgtA/B/C/D-like domain-containing protein n=1 Tax=Thermosyntropha lipolytica DSM 11003 TaxID=1123382 RepID=A0A1M5LL37_9FIRM|nr:hypothetical protein [Thermosyntropha lipolytica]SHG65399.1 hypothetical protein SAMN02745221_00681 [Thermosyntropha lipolytica DSM 11003]